MGEVKVLFIAANPRSTTRLMLDEEIRAITHKIRASQYRDTLQLESGWAVRPDDLLQLLNEHKPHVVHFSGHGSRAGQIILVDDRGSPKPVSTQAIKALFTTLKDNIQVVILNACYSRMQAKAIIEVIDCAIGMNDAIGDQAATIFAAAFYRAIGFGRSIQEAFNQGRVALLLEGIPEENTPELLVRAGVNPSLLFLIGEQTNGRAAGSPLEFASSQSYSQYQETEAARWILEADKHLERGNTYSDVQSYEYALDAYQQALSFDPYNAVAHEGAGNIHLYFENYEAALVAYNQSLYINPQNPAVYLNKADVLQRLERYDEALETYEQGICIDSDNPVLYEQKGNLLWRLGWYRESAAAYFVWLGKKLLALFKVGLERLRDMMSRSGVDDQE